MFILYQVTWVLGLLFGIAIGGTIAFLGTGWGGGVIGLVLGIAAGWLAALLLPEIVRHAILLSLRCSDTLRLKERLVREHGLAPMIIKVLVARGDPVEQYREHVQSLLQSSYRRSLGRTIAQKWFPELRS